ncbi:hypothetical protein N0B44_11100 [Roseibacterium beibuensis]|uniref:hypothetical protein n=1 Tax=[Roseibacterium] beibuensis TaxID=1193142 RepID=UPI00217D0C03|nr:hypothetical protein [Roseibacterium beibuensis]MCS6623462.1 hypothetical protein [Roseibacterium beibuensis]
MDGLEAERALHGGPTGVVAAHDPPHPRGQRPRQITQEGTPHPAFRRGRRRVRRMPDREPAHGARQAFHLQRQRPRSFGHRDFETAFKRQPGFAGHVRPLDRGADRDAAIGPDDRKLGRGGPTNDEELPIGPENPFDMPKGPPPVA